MFHGEQRRIEEKEVEGDEKGKGADSTTDNSALVVPDFGISDDMASKESRKADECP